MSKGERFWAAASVVIIVYNVAIGITTGTTILFFFAFGLTVMQIVLWRLRVRHRRLIAELNALNAQAQAAAHAIGTFQNTMYPMHLTATTIAPLRPTYDGSLPESTSDVPILAFKHAKLGYHERAQDQRSVFTLEPVFQVGPWLERDLDANCFVQPHSDVIPVVSCTCGFYACKTRDDPDYTTQYVPLDVELSGRVIVCTHGYRAQHQRILRAHVPTCSYCDAVPSDERVPAVGVIVTKHVRYAEMPVTALCARHRVRGKLTNEAMTWWVPLNEIADNLYGDIPLSDDWWK